MFGDTVEQTASDIIRKKLSKWLDNPPDYDDVQSIYRQYGALRAKIRLLQRDIERIEEEINADQEKPRSNEAKKAKNAATSKLRDQLAKLESGLVDIESRVKFIEYHKTMYNAASFQSRVLYDS